MKKLYFLTLAVLLAGFAAAQQQILMVETFNDGNHPFLFNDGGPGTNTGSNRWIVNNLYNGQPYYPNTVSQDSLVSGTIDGAPTSRYMHIHDEVVAAANGVANANWNPTAASDRFAYTGNSFCTLGLTDVIFTFFWLCDGDSNSYGEVYFRTDGGAWTKMGQPKYNAQHIWKYESIQDPRLNNKSDVQIGFRWINPGGGVTNTSFGIDDIIAVGNFNQNDTATGVELTTRVLNTQICQGDPLFITLNLSRPLCSGTYQMQLSAANGSFANPYNLGIVNLGPNFTSGTFTSLGTPGNIQGNCFRARVVRTSPAPVVISDTSACITIIQCPNEIFNVKAPVLSDVDTTCVLSVIDIQFNSIGIYRGNNQYIAELSDTNGAFTNPYFLGSLNTDDSFPSMPPGNIGGLIPQSVPAGCGYYIRVRSTNPVATSALVGPYCLVHCDELTNNHTDMHFCVQSGPYPVCDTLRIQKNYWDSQAQYDTCNNWTIQLRSMKDFSLVDQGSLGIFYDQVGGYYNLCMPATKNLLPVAPGTYYMRIVSNCSSLPWNQTGSVIRITIGAPDAIPPTIIADDSVYCRGELVTMAVSPFNVPPSEYEWSSNLLNNGEAFTWPYNPLYINLHPQTTLGDYVFYVREINFGCIGVSSDPARITIIGRPEVQITGPKTVCLGDTAQYNVTYLRETYYEWSAQQGVSALDRSNSQATMIFNKLGVYRISNYTLNSCGSDTGSYSVTVTPAYFNVNAGPDREICEGDTVTLTVETDPLQEQFVTQTNGNIVDRRGGMFDLIAHADLTVDSFAIRLRQLPGPNRQRKFGSEIYGKPGTYLGFEQDPNAWTMITLNYNLTRATSGFTVISAPVNIPLQAGDTFAFYVTNVDSPMYYANGGGAQGTVYKSDGVIDFVMGTMNEYPFGIFIPFPGYAMDLRIYYTSKGGFAYQWTTGDTLPTITYVPTQSGPVQVLVSDKGLCTNKDTVTILLKPSPDVDAGPDTTICPQAPYLMQASTSASQVLWAPVSGLSQAGILNPTVAIPDTQAYVLLATDPVNNCSSRDTVNINIIPIAANAGPDDTVCYDETYVLQASASEYQSLTWSPATGLSSVEVLQPTFDPNTGGGEYTLTIIDENGCSASDVVRLNVGCPAKIVAPQAIVPNGNPDNSHFRIWGKNIATYNVRIYNRWGQLVYDSGNRNDLYGINGMSEKLWDGRYKGAEQNVGTFVYYINATARDGEKLELKGNLTLIR